MWTDEQIEIRGLAREFAAGEIRPRAERWDREGRVDESVFRALAELGFLGMRVPEEHGGLGLEWTTCLLVLEELAWGDASLALAVAVHTGPVTTLLTEAGSREQKSRLLPRMASGELLGILALAEREAGSDPGGVATRAEGDGERWRLEGEKAWVSGAGRGGLAVVLARADDEPRLFLVEGEPEGLEPGEPERSMGLRGWPMGSLRLDGVTVSVDAVLEGAGGARGQLDAAAAVGRLSVAALCVGLARSALEHATRYAGEREQFGRPIGRFGGIEEKLASMAGAVARSRALAHAAARRVEAGPSSPAGGLGELDGVDVRSACALARVEASETAVRVADDAVQIFGGYGYMRDYPVERLLRDAKGTEMLHGTTDVLRSAVARSLLDVDGSDPVGGG